MANLITRNPDRTYLILSSLIILIILFLNFKTSLIGYYQYLSEFYLSLKGKSDIAEKCYHTLNEIDFWKWVRKDEHRIFRMRCEGGRDGTLWANAGWKIPSIVFPNMPSIGLPNMREIKIIPTFPTIPFLEPLTQHFLIVTFTLRALSYAAIPLLLYYASLPPLSIFGFLVVYFIVAQNFIYFVALLCLAVIGVGFGPTRLVPTSLRRWPALAAGTVLLSVGLCFINSMLGDLGMSRIAAPRMSSMSLPDMPTVALPNIPRVGVPSFSANFSLGTWPALPEYRSFSFTLGIAGLFFSIPAYLFPETGFGYVVKFLRLVEFAIVLAAFAIFMAGYKPYVYLAPIWNKIVRYLRTYPLWMRLLLGLAIIVVVKILAFLLGYDFDLTPRVEWLTTIFWVALILAICYGIWLFSIIAILVLCFLEGYLPEIFPNFGMNNADLEEVPPGIFEKLREKDLRRLDKLNILLNIFIHRFHQYGDYLRPVVKAVNFVKKMLGM